MDSLKRYCIIGASVTIVAGIVSHFVYEWSGESFLVGLFFPVNESTWEHMKLVFFPMLLFSLAAGRRRRGEYPCIISASFLGILAGTWLIPVLFYTYRGILGFDVAWVNILTFVLSVIGGFAVVYQRAESCTQRTARGLRLVIDAFVLAFMIFTVYPPGIGLFQAP